MTTHNPDPAPRTARLTEWSDPADPHTELTVHEAERAFSFLSGLDYDAYVEAVFYGRHGRAMKRAEKDQALNTYRV